MLKLIAKAHFVAFLAALLSGLPIAVLLSWDMDVGLRLPVFLNLMTLAFVGVFAIGLPLSLIIFRFVKDNPDIQIGMLTFLANVSALFLTLVFVAEAGVFGAIFFGVPITIAANVFAIAGWFTLLKPTRELSKEVR